VSQSIWSVLGLRATRDVTEIKRAYAAKLKAIDLDSDPSAFQALREARDIAIQLARQSDDVEAGLVDQAAAVPVPEEAVTAAEGSSERDARKEQNTEQLDPNRKDLNEHHQALCGILFDQHDGTFYAATPEEEQAIQRHFAAIAANPVLQDIDTLTNASNWFAGAIAQMIPRSDSLIEPASQLFSWDKADELGADPALAAVMHRRADLHYRDQVSRPAHKLHGAWRELTKPANESSKRGWVRRKKVGELLSAVRSDHPTLERDFDWYRVSMWENQGSSGGDYRLWPIGFLLFLALRICSAVSHNDTPRTIDPYPAVPATESSQASSMTTPERDIDQAIRDYSNEHINGEQLRLGNPSLYQLLKSNWLVQRDEGASPAAFTAKVSSLINEHLEGQWTYASGDMLADRYRLMRDAAKSQAATSAEACRLFFAEGAQQLNQVDRQRQAELTMRRVMEIDGTRQPVQQPSMINFSIPGSVMKDVADRTGLGQSELKRALDLKGDALTVCKVRLALLDSVLELPPTSRTRILRDMATD
jgi:hypothetical protein